jgi:hypothetical protein
MPRHSESSSQQSVITWFALAARSLHAEPGDLWAIPNGGRRDEITGAILKREGVRAGVPDLFLAVPVPVHGGRSRAGLFIEMKTWTGRVSKAQQEAIFRLRRRGYECVVAHGFDQASRAITQYLEGRDVML